MDMDRQIDTQTDRQIDRYTHRQTDRQTDRQTNRQAHNGYLEAGNDAATALLGVGGSVRQLVHHSDDLCGGSLATCVIQGEGWVTKMPRLSGGDQHQYSLC